MPFLAAIPAAIGIGGAGAGAAAGGAAVGAGAAAAAGTGAAVAGGATVGSLAGITAGVGAGAAFGGATAGASVLAGTTGIASGMLAGGATVGGLASGTGAMLAGAGGAAAGSTMLSKIGQGMSLMGTMSDMSGSIMQGNALSSSISAAGASNAHMAELNAQEAKKIGMKNELKAGGVQLTAFAKGGVVTSMGSPLQVMHDTTEAIHLNTMNEVNKWYFQARSLREQADRAAEDAQHAGFLGGMTRGLGGFGSFLGKIGRLDPSPVGKSLWGGTPGTIG